MTKLPIIIGIAGVALAGLAAAGPAAASTVAEREYKRGYSDCAAGRFDQDQHADSYMKGCRAAEGAGTANAPAAGNAPNKGAMKANCKSAVKAKFNRHTREINITDVERQDYGWGVFGNAVLKNGSSSDFVCKFNSNGKFKRVNASAPIGGNADQIDTCPDDVSEADRYKYPACN